MENQTSIRALALVGMPGAGKTLCAHHLQDRGFYQFRFGGIVENEVVRRGWDVKPENERIVREEFRAEHGMAAMAILARPHLQKALQIHETIVIDGLYSWSEYKALGEEFGTSMVVVNITCDRNLRYSRLENREIRPLTRVEAVQRDHQEIEKLEKGGPIAIADYTLLNNGTGEELLAKLDALLEKLNISA